MAVLFVITIISILFVMVGEFVEERKRYIFYRWLTAVAVIGLLTSFGMLIYDIAHFTA